MARKKKDILIHYDEEAGALICCSVDSTLTSEIRKKALPLSTNVDTYRQKSPSEAERIFGATLFALIDLHSNKKILIRHYEEVAEEKIKEFAASPSALAASDPHAKYEYALELIAMALRHKLKPDIHKVEELLQEAASEGHREAAEYRDSFWPELKARLQKKGQSRK